MRSQRGESGDGHVIAATPGLGTALAPCRGGDLGSRLAIRIWDRALWVAIVRLILGMSSVLDIVAVALLALHDVMDNTRRVVLSVVLCAMPQLPLLALTVALVDVAACVSCTPILIKVRAEVSISRTVRPRLVGVVLVNLLLDGGEFAVRRWIRLIA
jgi:hypothetical protein